MFVLHNYATDLMTRQCSYAGSMIDKKIIVRLVLCCASRISTPLAKESEQVVKLPDRLQ